MKKQVLLFLLIGFAFQAYAQQINITGAVFDDASKETIESASIRILNAKDSVYVTGTTSDKVGKFMVKANQGRYIVQISFMGYLSQYRNVNTSENANIGTVYLKENSVLLNEAVVTAKAVEIQVKGDTVEYNADSYKVQQSAVVEDLLKKMPGVEIDSDGKITVNGKEVKKFLVDGKEFFSNDPKVASKNLPAAMVNKLQVLDRKSDMSQMTGFDDGSEETVINLTTKPGMKEGLFGNAFAGYGSKDRYETNGMVNYMRNKTQITALAGSNNTNNAGFSDFASNTFSGNRPRGVNFGGKNGVTKSANGGFNFATDYSPKLKLGGNIRYGFSDNDVNTESNSYYTALDRTTNSDSKNNNVSNNFGADFRFEWSPDSLTRVIFVPSIQYNTNRNSSVGNNMSIDNRFGDLSNNTRFSSAGHGTTFNGNLDISRQLSKEGRTLSFTFSGGLSNANSDGLNYSKNTYFTSDPNLNDSLSRVKSLDQQFFQDDKSNNWKMFASYVEPIGRSNFLQLTYTVRKTISETDRLTYSRDSLTNDFTLLDSAYTRDIRNEFLNQNVTLNFKSVRAKYNYTVGLGLEPSTSNTELFQLSESKNDIPQKSFLSIVPTMQFNYLWDKRHNLRLEYTGTTNQATALQLSDARVRSNDGVTTTVGNPNLKPSFVHQMRLRYQKFNPQTSSAILVFGRFTYTLNDIVTATNWADVSSNTLTYQNISGNMSGNLRFIYNTPLKNKKFSANTMTFFGYTRSNTYIDSIQNGANIYNVQENAGIQFRSDKFDFNVRGNIKYTGITNTAQSGRNQRVFDYGSFGSITYYLPKGVTFDSDIEYTTNSGYSNGFKLNAWLWNASVSKQVFKNKAGLIRLKMNDILQQRANITRQVNSQYIQDISTNVLPSYFMVNFVYKFQVFKGGLKRSDMEDTMPGSEPRGGGFGGGRPGGGTPGRF